MKSTSISLLYEHRRDEQASGGAEERDAYLINLVDSPGHVDFGGEVTTALAAMDGALLLVDVVEGVCSQTETVLRHCWRAGVRPVLVLNKIDRLLDELHLEPQEAYERICHVLQQVNASVATLRSAEYVAAADRAEDMAAASLRANEDEGGESSSKSAKPMSTSSSSSSLVNMDDASLDDYFSPASGNVVFASASNGWAFRIEQFARLYATKLGMSFDVLRRTLWGEFYFNRKTKRIMKKPTVAAPTPMFVQFVLANVANLRSSVLDESNDVQRIEKLAAAVGIKLDRRELSDPKRANVFSCVMRRWLPLTDAVLPMVVESVSSPSVAQRERLSILFPGHEGDEQRYESVFESVRRCDASAPNALAYITKVFAVPHDIFAGDPSATPQCDGDVPRHFIGFGRVFCGTLRVGDRVFVQGGGLLLQEATRDTDNEHGGDSDAEKSDEKVESLVVDHLYLIMGRHLESVASVPAGNVFGIGGFGEHVLKAATLSTSLPAPRVASAIHSIAPILRVALEPEVPADMMALREGLRALNRSDPVVQVLVQESGEHIVVCAGEMHMERCLAELHEFANVPFIASPPVVPFRETITSELAVHTSVRALLYSGESDEDRTAVGAAVHKDAGDADAGNAVPSPSSSTASVEGVAYTSAVVSAQTSDGGVALSVDAVPLPQEIIEFLESNERVWRDALGDGSVVVSDATRALAAADMRKVFNECGAPWSSALDHVLALGPRRIGANLLIADTDELMCGELSVPSVLDGADRRGASVAAAELLPHVLHGFQQATQAGPLCDEPMHGVCFILKSLSVPDSSDWGGSAVLAAAATRRACRRAFMRRSPRLYEPVYRAEVVVPAELLGKAYSVLGKRRARILSELPRYGTNLFCVEAVLPVATSFGFVSELSGRTSGAAVPQLRFDRFELLDEDPFYRPTTAEELEEWGTNVGGLAPNVARQYMDEVRERKGLMTERQLVVAAEKQRTLTKNK